MVGTATVTVTLQDNGGTANGGSNTSAPQTFTITVTPSPTATSVTSSSSPAPFGVSIALRATVVPVAPGVGVPAGSVTFKRGTTTIGSAALVAGVATLNTSTLAVGTHAITAVYAGSPNYAASTSPAMSQVISPSAKLAVTFTLYSIGDLSQPAVGDVRTGPGRPGEGVQKE